MSRMQAANFTVEKGRTAIGLMAVQSSYDLETGRRRIGNVHRWIERFGKGGQEGHGTNAR